MPNTNTFKKYCIFLKETYELSNRQLDLIFALKNQHWNYGLRSQKEWFSNNIKQHDMHLFVYQDNKIIGYANLVRIKCLFNEKCFNALGIGNVCTSKLVSGKGFGHLIMSAISTFLKSNNYAGFLFCKDRLVSFYLKNKWSLLNYNQLLVNGIEQKYNVFIQNLPEMIDASKNVRLSFDRTF